MAKTAVNWSLPPLMLSVSIPTQDEAFQLLISCTQTITCMFRTITFMLSTKKNVCAVQEILSEAKYRR